MVKSVSDTSKVSNEKKQNLETDEMWSDIVMSHISPKLRAQLAGETLTFEGMDGGSEILESCLKRPTRRHSVLTEYHGTHEGCVERHMKFVGKDVLILLAYY